VCDLFRAGIAQSHKDQVIWAGRSRVLIPAVVRDFSFLQNMQTGYDAQPASYSIGNGALFQGVKQLGHKGNHSPPFSAEVKND